MSPPTALPQVSWYSFTFPNGSSLQAEPFAMGTTSSHSSYWMLMQNTWWDTMSNQLGENIRASITQREMCLESNPGRLIRRRVKYQLHHNTLCVNSAVLPVYNRSVTPVPVLIVLPVCRCVLDRRIENRVCGRSHTSRRNHISFCHSCLNNNTRKAMWSVWCYVIWSHIWRACQYHMFVIHWR